MKKLEEQLSVLVEKAIEAAEKTGEFAIEQAPLLLQEFYTWHIVYKSMILLATLIVIFLGKNIITKFGESERKKVSLYITDETFTLFGKYYSSYSWEFFFIVFYFITVIGMTVVSFIHLMDIVQIIVAPKLYLIEYFLK